MAEDKKKKRGRALAWISADDSAGCLLKKLAGLVPAGGDDDIYNEVVEGYSAILDSSWQYVPDDIVCYSDMTVGQFLQGAVMAMKKPERADAVAEAVRLMELFEINREEPLLDMTFEQNRLVAMIQSLIWKPGLFLLNQPHDMIGGERYHLLLKEWENHCAQGGNVLIAAHAYTEIALPCERYVYLRDGKVVTDYKKEQLIDPAKVVTMSGGKPEVMEQSKMLILHEKEERIQFIYKETDMKKLLERLQKTGCRDFTVEDITREELVFEDYERWSL